jgi:Fis family transcriptional regulator
MTMQLTATRRHHSEQLAVTERTGRETLQECVRQALQQYFSQLGDHRPSELYQLVMCEVEQPLFETVMIHVGGNQTRAAAILGISRGTLRKKLEKYGLG